MAIFMGRIVPLVRVLDCLAAANWFFCLVTFFLGGLKTRPPFWRGSGWGIRGAVERLGTCGAKREDVFKALMELKNVACCVRRYNSIRKQNHRSRE